MKGRCFNLITVLLGLALISGCNLQVAGPVTGDAVGTAIAGTMAAQTELANIVVGTLRAMMTNTPTVTPTSQFSLTPSLTPLPTLTATPPFPMVSVTMDTNCRSGPGKVYDMIGALPVGKSAEVVGRDAYNQYWIIQNPNNPGTCWLWGQYATVTGDTSQLPVIAAPPTPTPLPTHKPNPVVTNLTITIEVSAFHHPLCHSFQGYTVTITTNGPTTVHYVIKSYFNGAENATLDSSSLSFASAETKTFIGHKLDDDLCGTWVYRIFVTSPNGMASEASFTVVH